MKISSTQLIEVLRSVKISRDTKKTLDKIWNSTIRQCNIKTLTNAQIKQIQEYWEPIVGHKVSTKWHLLLYSITGVFKPEYEPFEVCMKVQNALSPIREQWYFDDKGLYRQLLSGFTIPVRVAECVKGIYRLPTVMPGEVDLNTFQKYLEGLSDCIIKPSRETDGGNGVMSFDICDGHVQSTNERVATFIEKYQKKYGKNFVIEEKVHECDNLQCLNPTSCNTLRVHTYRNREKHEIQFLSSYIRIGKLGKEVDNAHSGGFCGRIGKDGYLDRIVRVYPYYQGTMTESGIDVSHYKIENFDKIINTVKIAHSSLPMFDLVGWDVTVNNKDEVVIIEFNPNPDVRIEQCIFDSTCLGEFQEDIIRRVYKRNK